MCYDPLNVVEELEGDAKEEGEGEAMDVVETDNEDIGADTKG